MNRFIRYGISIFTLVLLISTGCEKNNVKPSEEEHEYYLTAHQLYYEQKDIREALIHYQKITPKSPMYIAALIQRCRLYEQLEDWQSVRTAIHDFTPLQEKYPYFSHFFLAYSVKASLGMYDYTNIEHYENSAMTIEDDYFRSSVLLGIARLYELNNTPEKALRIYRSMFYLRARFSDRALFREQYRSLLFTQKFSVETTDIAFARMTAENYPEETALLLQRAQERTEQWWLAYASLPAKHRFSVPESDNNGYIIAQNLQKMSLHSKKATLEQALLHPRTTMVKPLILVLLRDYFTPDYFYKHSAVLNDTEYDEMCQRALRFYLVQSDFYGLSNFLSRTDLNRFSPRRKAHFLFWQGYAVLKSTQDIRSAKAFFEYSIQENPHSYYHQIISELTDIPFSITLKEPVQNVPDSLRHLLTKLSDYGDYETVYAVQESLDDSFFRDTFSLFLPIYAATGQSQYLIEASAHLTRLYNIENELLEWFYPIVLEDEFNRAAEKVTLPDSALLRALIHQESSFRHDARSRVGATGLMQLMPKTAKPLLKKYFPDIKDHDLTDSVMNIVCGTAYYNDMLSRFGKKEYALGAYNGGPGRMKSWISQFGDRPMVEFVELIPYDETRDYIKSVIKKYAIYSHLHEIKKP